MIKIDISKLSPEALDCLINEGETYAGLQYLGITPSAITVPYQDEYGDVFQIPDHLIVNPDLLTQERLDLIERLEDDIDHPEANAYYTFMKGINQHYLSGDDSYFDYGNSFVTTIAYEVRDLL